MLCNCKSSLLGAILVQQILPPMPFYDLRDDHGDLSLRPTSTAPGRRPVAATRTRIVVTERFVIRIPPGADLAATALLLCAGITTFSPMQHWRLGPGQRVGVIGLGP